MKTNKFLKLASKYTDKCVFFKETANNWLNKGGYGVYGGEKLQYAHRVAYEEHYGEIPEGKLVLHKCGNKSCINPKHLYAGTDKENAADRERHGNTVRGEIHYKSKCSDAIVRMSVLLANETTMNDRIVSETLKQYANVEVAPNTIYFWKKGLRRTSALRV